MNDLIVPLTDDEKGMVANELDKLYSFQDRPLSKEKKAHMVQEITTHGYPFKAVIQGIRDMFSEELKAIKLASILESIREKIEPGSIESTDCDKCDKSGFVILADPNYYEKMFACVCPNASKWSGSKLVRWGGDEVQMVRNVLYRIPERLRPRKR